MKVETGFSLPTYEEYKDGLASSPELTEKEFDQITSAKHGGALRGYGPKRFWMDRQRRMKGLRRESIDEWDFSREISRAIEGVVREHAEAINANDGSAIVVEEVGVFGGHLSLLPTPSVEHLGRIAVTQGTGASSSDQVWICIRYTAGNYEWREIVV